MGSCSFQKISKKRLALLSVTAISVAFVLLCRWNTDVAEWYMQAIYPVLAVALSYFSNIFPFSLFDILTIAAVAILIFSIVQLFRRKLKFLRWLYYLTMSVVWIALWFYLSWGVGYFRHDYYSRSEVSRTNTSIEDFSRIILEYIEILDSSHIPINQINKSEINIVVENSYAKLYKELKLPYPNGKRKPKQTIYQPLQTKMGITGFFAPFFNEVHVNSDVLPFSYPFILAHEKAHQLGITSEAECNLYAIIVCTSSEHRQVKYSGYYELVGYLLSALRKASPELYADAYKHLSQEVRNDFKREHEFWQQAISPGLNELQTKVYDSYLKSNNISSGIVNYSEVVELFLAWEHQNNSITSE